MSQPSPNNIPRLSDLKPRFGLEGYEHLPIDSLSSVVGDEEFVVETVKFVDLVNPQGEPYRLYTFGIDFKGRKLSSSSGGKAISDTLSKYPPPFRAKLVLIRKGNRKYYRFC